MAVLCGTVRNYVGTERVNVLSTVRLDEGLVIVIWVLPAVARHSVAKWTKPNHSVSCKPYLPCASYADAVFSHL